MDRKSIFIGIGVLVIILLVWYCIPTKSSKNQTGPVEKMTKLSNRGRSPIPMTLEDLSRLSKYKKPIMGAADDFLTPDECQEIINIGKLIVKPSSVGFGKEGNIDNAARSSQHSWIKHDATTGLVRLTQYISTILKLPATHFEPFQIVHYGPDQFYKYHLDHCNPYAADYTECLKNAKEFGGRKYTVLVYLNKDYLAGETHFKELNTTVKGDPGSLLFFKNMKEDSSESDPLSLHAGTPVIEGEKWLLNVWVRDIPYLNDYSNVAFPCPGMIEMIEQNIKQQDKQESPRDDELPSHAPPKQPDTVQRREGESSQ